MINLKSSNTELIFYWVFLLSYIRLGYNLVLIYIVIKTDFSSFI